MSRKFIARPQIIGVQGLKKGAERPDVFAQTKILGAKGPYGKLAASEPWRTSSAYALRTQAGAAAPAPGPGPLPRPAVSGRRRKGAGRRQASGHWALALERWHRSTGTDNAPLTLKKFFRKNPGFPLDRAAAGA